MNSCAVYPGTFDPITYGHIDIVRRAAKIFSKITIAVADNSPKKPHFALNTRIALIKEALEGLPNVSVKGFSNLLIDFVHQEKATIILRGLRAVNDFEYEFQLAGMNRKLCSLVETVFLTPSENFLFISSSLVREIASLKGDVSQFVPPCVVKALELKA